MASRCSLDRQRSAALMLSRSRSSSAKRSVSSTATPSMPSSRLEYAVDSPRCWLRQQRGLSTAYSSLDDGMLGVAVDDTERLAELDLDRESIRAALRCLSSEQREAIELAYFGSCTQVEIAA